MELSERCIAQLEKEGYETVYEEQLSAGELLPISNLDTSIFITEGSVVIESFETTTLLAGDRYQPLSIDKPVHAGDQGCQLVIGKGLVE